MHTQNKANEIDKDYNECNIIIIIIIIMKYYTHAGRYYATSDYQKKRTHATTRNELRKVRRYRHATKYAKLLRK